MARDFTAVGNVCSVGDYDAILGTTASFHIWARITTGGVNNELISKWGSGQLGYNFLIGTGNNLGLTDPNNVTVVSASALSTGVWYALGGRFTGANKQVLINGVQDGSSAFSGSIPNVSSALKIGADDFGSNFFHGRLAEAAIWDVSLSDAEFLALARGASPLSIRRDHLKLYMPLFGVASPEPDISGAGKTGTTTAAVADHAPVGRLSRMAG